MTKLEVELTLKLLDKIIDEHIRTFEGGDRKNYKEIPSYEIEPLRNDIKDLIKKICEVDE